MSIEEIESGSFSERRTSSGAFELRIISWNIARGTRYDAVCDFLRRSAADLILLQEVDKNCRRTGNRNIAKELSSCLRMNYVFGTEFQELAQEAGDSPAYHGQATLSPWPILNARIMRFRNQSKFWAPTWWIPTLARFQRRIGGRAALVTDVCVGKARVTAYNLHLESRGGDNLRDSQLREVLQDAAQAERESPVVLGGDFNFELAGTDQAVTFCDAGFRNPFEGRSQPTIVNSRGTRRAIDCILMSRGIRPVSVRVHSDVAASDHYPLSLTVVIES